MRIELADPGGTVHRFDVEARPLVIADLRHMLDGDPPDGLAREMVEAVRLGADAVLVAESTPAAMAALVDHSNQTATNRTDVVRCLVIDAAALAALRASGVEVVEMGETGETRLGDARSDVAAATLAVEVAAYRSGARVFLTEDVRRTRRALDAVAAVVAVASTEGPT